MRKVLKVIGLVVAALVLLVGVAAVVIKVRGPKTVPPSTEKIVSTPERVAEGKYLANGVALCVFCHSEHDQSLYTWPVRPDRVGSGQCMPEWTGLPGKQCPGNLTSDPQTGLGRWTDGEILRSIRDNVRRDGSAMFPIHNYDALDDEQARAIVAYLRTLPPIVNDPGKSELGFPMNIAINLLISPVTEPVHAPAKTDRVAYGKYLVHLGECGICHTNDHDQLAGGQTFEVQGQTVIAHNLTPDPATGLGALTEPQFVAMFKAFQQMRTLKLTPGAPNRLIMPWSSFANMSDEDLGAIYAYLRSLPPVVTPAPAAKGK